MFKFEEARLFAADVAAKLVLITTDMVVSFLDKCDCPSSPRAGRIRCRPHRAR
jgi:hypothetical protein